MMYRNIKNQKIYKVICNSVIDKTTGAEDKLMVFYEDESGNSYVREQKEFYTKFELTHPHRAKIER